MPPTAVQVREQLGRILASRALAGSDQLKRLLEAVVERALNGQSDLVKEYNLGLEVFRRPADYDPKTDPIVRVQARRLRSKLEEYYAGEGAQDPVRIAIPRGAYVPVFEAAALAAPAEPVHRRLFMVLSAAIIIAAAFILAWQGRTGLAASAHSDRSVAVLPLRDFTGSNEQGHMAGKITEILTTELARNGKLRVVSATTASKYARQQMTLPEIASALRVRWVVEGGVGTEGTRAYVKLRAVDSAIDRKVWANVFDGDVGEIVPLSTKAAASIGAAIEDRMRLSAK